MELCAVDHRNDRTILTRWLANKTPENVECWITQPGTSVPVAIEGDRILGVGSVTDAGRITLNYVSPDARSRGASRALLAALGARAAARGNAQANLNSTDTAKRFYLAAGYVENGPPASLFGTQAGYPLKSAWPLCRPDLVK